MTTYFYIADRLGVRVDSGRVDSVVSHLSKEYADFKRDDIPAGSLYGIVDECPNPFPKEDMRELVKDRLYEDAEYPYVKYGSRYARINLTAEAFEISYEPNFDGYFLFHIIEVLVRMYAHKAGIDFFHASSFRYAGKVFMLNGFGGSGKTEIMINFLIKGAAFIADDLAIVNAKGQIFPYRVTIPLRWGAITDEFVDHLKISRRLYNLCKYCQSHENKMTRRIYGRVVWRHFIGDYSYRQISDVDVTLKFQDVDHCIWLQEAGHAGPFELGRDEYFKYMDLCLKNESRKYFDIEGFLRLKFPQVKAFDAEKLRLRQTICDTSAISGLAVKNRDYRSATEYIYNTYAK